MNEEQKSPTKKPLGVLTKITSMGLNVTEGVSIETGQLKENKSELQGASSLLKKWFEKSVFRWKIRNFSRHLFY